MNATSSTSTSVSSSVMSWPVLRSPMATLVRRELWEHRSLWIAPLAVAALLLFGVITGAVLGKANIEPSFDGSPGQAGSALALGVLSFTVPQLLVMGTMLFFYLQDCLYTERKDRSILFWKSMPVSDAATVLSKLLTALVVVPIGVFLLTLVTDLIVGAIAAATVKGASAIWNTVGWLKIRAAMACGLVLVTLWFAPIAAYVLLLSAWARRNVFLWIVLPPMVLMLVENRATGSHYVAAFLNYRMNGIWNYFGSHTGFAEWSGGLPSMGALLESVGGSRVLSNLDLWLGLVAAALLTYAAIRVRRFRDDNS